MATSVCIFGPNLNDQSKGQFHVHRKGCGDCKHYGPGRRFGGELEMPLKVQDLQEVVEFVYSDQIGEQPEGEHEDYIDRLWGDFFFAPCLKEVPRESAKS